MAIELTLLGTGGPRPDAARSQSAAVVVVDGERYLVDCGDGTVRRLLDAGIVAADLSTLILTHLHVDHCFGVAPFIYAGWYDARPEMRIFGPNGTRALVDDQMKRTFGPDGAQRIANGRPGRGLQDSNVVEYGAGFLLETNACRVTATRVKHPAPSETHALRFEDDGGKSLVISSDTAYYEPLVTFAEGADLLVHECYLVGGSQFARETAAFRDRMHEVHVTPEEAGAVGRLAGARRLVLTHFPAKMDEAGVAERASRAFGSPVIIGRDLMRLEV